MNCIIVDDEPLAVELIESFVQKVPQLNLVGMFNNAIDAMQSINSNSVDLVFLDIQMPNITGIEFAKSLKHPPLIIFTTAYSNYAVEGFNLDAVDYLVKPIPFDRFLKAVNKASELYNLKKQKPAIENPKPEQHGLSEKYIMVKADYSLLRVDLDKILYIEGLKDYLKIFIEGRKAILTISSFKNIESKLPSEYFIRVHRSYIVSLPKIESIQRHRIKINKELIPIGDIYKSNFYNKIEDKNL